LATTGLLLDLDSEAQAEQLRTEVRRLAESAQLRLQEALPAPEHAWVGGPGGRFSTELMVPLVRQHEKASSDTSLSAPRLVTAHMAADRLRPPGSDWLFIKLYCPRVFQDDLLTGPVHVRLDLWSVRADSYVIGARLVRVFSQYGVQVVVVYFQREFHIDSAHVAVFSQLPQGRSDLVPPPHSVGEQRQGQAEVGLAELG